MAIFWHIPWPNPEAFGICPWQRELLDGLLGADLIGFHIQSHCNNFLETVDRALESRIDWEHFAVNRHGHLTLVRPFPISVAVRKSRHADRSPQAVYKQRAALLNEHGRGGDVPGRRRGSRGLHQGNSGALPRHRALPRKISGLPGQVHLRADRRAQPHPHQALSRSDGGSGSRGGAHQPALPDRQVEAHRVPQAASQPRGDRALTTGPPICAW